MMTTSKYEICERCDGEGEYFYDTGYDYSYMSGTYSFMAECEDCRGTGRIYEDDEEEGA